MKVEGTREFAAPAQNVWDVLNDPDSIASLLPGVASFEVADDTHWSARVKVPLGMGGLKLKFAFTKLEERPIEFARLAAKGNGVGAMVNMDTSFTLTPKGDATTHMAWEADVRVAGPGRRDGPARAGADHPQQGRRRDDGARQEAGRGVDARLPRLAPDRWL